ncbi:hypothetical protein BCR44DRAFT_1025707 [Catenaria anguillulae PL171]|uniref:Uncharacterized protein n=1 Tax=Catenaria anguillulae PL171 TaxID=765915 RepID=A0A1Y2HV19_9FUNG|nr:hypothetical protein BCR44DRAFT_1025707 [Catenaria anguillulae PL171]
MSGMRLQTGKILRLNAMYSNGFAKHPRSSKGQLSAVSFDRGMEDYGHNDLFVGDHCDSMPDPALPMSLYSVPQLDLARLEYLNSNPTMQCMMDCPIDLEPILPDGDAVGEYEWSSKATQLPPSTLSSQKMQSSSKFTKKPVAPGAVDVTLDDLDPLLAAMRGCQLTSTSSSTADLCGTMIAPQGSAVGPSSSGKSALERARRDRSLRKLHQQRSAMRAMTQAQIAQCLAVEPEADSELCDNVKTQRLVMEQKKCEQEERKKQEAARKMQIELQTRIAKEQEDVRRQQREARQRMILERVEQYCAVRDEHVLMVWSWCIRISIS